MREAIKHLAKIREECSYLLSSLNRSRGHVMPFSGVPMLDQKLMNIYLAVGATFALLPSTFTEDNWDDVCEVLRDLHATLRQSDFGSMPPEDWDDYINEFSSELSQVHDFAGRTLLAVMRET